MTTHQKARKIRSSIELQRRTLQNLEALQLADAGATIQLTRQIISNLEASLRLLGVAAPAAVPTYEAFDRKGRAIRVSVPE